jgi:hypothetical protein
MLRQMNVQQNQARCWVRFAAFRTQEIKGDGPIFQNRQVEVTRNAFQREPKQQSVGRAVLDQDDSLLWHVCESNRISAGLAICLWKKKGYRRLEAFAA